MRGDHGQPSPGIVAQAMAIALLLIILVTSAPMPVRASQVDISREQELANRYAPHIVLRQQKHFCDPDGEPYMPLPIEAVLNDPQVMLRKNTGGNDASFDPIVAYAPTLADITGLGSDYYLDFPGNPLNPGCYYEQWSRSKAQEFAPSIYARIVTPDEDAALQELPATPGVDQEIKEPLLTFNRPAAPEGLVIQYWFFYLFNDFNNKHEGDWEMIQLNFDVDTVEQALDASPVYITAAQHGGGERTEWNGKEFAADGTHPLVYSAAGSHATHFEDKLFIGWGQNGTGFGCDDTRSPGSTISPEVILIPTDYQDRDEFGWLSFDGRWGEKQSWEFNGPRGPQYGKKWNEPIAWITTTRETSLFIPDTLGLGPMPGNVFCNLADVGSDLLIFFTLHPRWTVVLGIVALALIVGLVMLVRRPIVSASQVYFRYRGSIGSIAVVLIPLGFLVTILQQALTSTPPLEWVIDLVGRSETARLAASLAVGEVLALLEALVIAPAVIAIMEQIRRNQRTDAPTAWRSVRNRFPDIARSWLSISVRTFVLAITLVGLPWAIRNWVRWMFFTHAIMIDDVHESQQVRARSAEVVQGKWIASAVQWAVFTLVTIAPGPLIGVALLVLFSPGIELVNVLSSMVYAHVMPFKAIALTLLYYTRTGRYQQFMQQFAKEDTGRDSVDHPLGEPAQG